MNSRLPQELQTRKVVSLPDDIRSVVEDLIIQKFDIPEVVGGSNDNAFFDPAQVREAVNTLVITIRQATGQIYRLAQIISLDLRELRSFEYQREHGYNHPIFVAWARRIAQEVDKKIPAGMIRDVEAEMNGYRDRIEGIESLQKFMYTHYRDRDFGYRTMDRGRYL